MSLHVNEMRLAGDAAFTAPDKAHEEINGDFAHMQRGFDDTSQAGITIGQPAADGVYFSLVPHGAKDLMIAGGDDIGAVLANPIPQMPGRPGDVCEQGGDNFREMKFLFCKISGKELVSDAVIMCRTLNKARATVAPALQLPHGFQHGEIVRR